MTRYILKRLLLMIPVILGISLLVFAMMEFSPGDPAQIILGIKATPDALESLRAELGLDQPFWTRYFSFIADALRGDFGTSWRTNLPVLQEIMERLPNTIRLALGAMFLMVLVGIPVGILSAVKQYSLLDTRISLSASLVIITAATIFGAFFGALAAYYGGKVDNLIMRVMDVFYALPFNLMAICIVASLGNGIFNLGLACVIGVIPGFTRVFRSAILPIRNQEYIEAAKACNTTDWRILTKHILPNALGPIIVQATLNLAITILAIAGLSFIGLGIQPPAPEWGAMLSEGREQMRNYPYLVIFPGLAIMVSAMSLNLIGDGLRDALDPKLKN